HETYTRLHILSCLVFSFIIHFLCIFFQCSTHPSVLLSFPTRRSSDLQYFVDMAQDVKHFLNGQDDKIVNELKAKMQAASDEMAFERAAEYRDWLQSISSLRTKQRVMNQDMMDRDIFGYYVDKGWMCVQVFFVRQGKLIQRDVNMFPYYDEPEEDFLTYVGQFYRDKKHFV